MLKCTYDKLYGREGLQVICGYWLSSDQAETFLVAHETDFHDVDAHWMGKIFLPENLLVPLLFCRGAGCAVHCSRESFSPLREHAWLMTGLPYFPAALAAMPFCHHEITRTASQCSQHLMLQNCVRRRPCCNNTGQSWRWRYFRAETQQNMWDLCSSACLRVDSRTWFASLSPGFSTLVGSFLWHLYIHVKSTPLRNPMPSGNPEAGISATQTQLPWTMRRTTAGRFSKTCEAKRLDHVACVQSVLTH